MVDYVIFNAFELFYLIEQDLQGLEIADFARSFFSARNLLQAKQEVESRSKIFA